MPRTFLGWSLATVLLAASAAIPAAAGRPVRIFDVTTAYGVVNGIPVEPADTFAPEDTPIYVWFRCEGCAIGSEIEASWLYLEQEPPVRFAHGSVVVATEDDHGEFHCELASGQPWPPGEYRIELRVDEVLLAETRFSVVARQPARGSIRAVAESAVADGLSRRHTR